MAVFACAPADWPDVQKTRVAVIKAYNDASREQKAGILKDLVIILLHSVTPPGERRIPLTGHGWL